MNSFWLHPSLILIAGALLLPAVPARLKKGFLLLVPVLLFARILTMAPGMFGEVRFQDWVLVFGRVDRLSSVFGYIMGLMCILGTLYGLHVKKNGQHIAAWIYVAGSIGAIYAGDFITLFLFWEMMAFSSVFLVWFRRRPESLAAGYRYLLVHVAGGLVLLAGMVLHFGGTKGIWAFDHLDVQHPTAAIYLIMAGFLLNAAVPPLHAWLPDAYGEATFNGSVFLCAFTTKTAVYALCRGLAGMEILVPLGVDHGALRRGLCGAGERLPQAAGLPYHQPGRLHGGGGGAGDGDGDQRRLRPCLRAYTLQGASLHGLRLGAAHDGRKQVHRAGRVVEEDAVDVPLYARSAGFRFRRSRSSADLSASP